MHHIIEDSSNIDMHLLRMFTVKKCNEHRFEKCVNLKNVGWLTIRMEISICFIDSDFDPNRILQMACCRKSKSNDTKKYITLKIRALISMKSGINIDNITAGVMAKWYCNCLYMFYNIISPCYFLYSELWQKAFLKYYLSHFT